ncbi:LuxR C-terminal-related transcriptional regulator [Nocardia yamanashiensis]|uniref:LuxR C-terminal-related transcriptional regulator n=1 Tax=Nocardia yamanashiensis TaxID=209247 RepID=UPI00083137B1|nr:LuxR C-terminal-related transcriptional regulator [Nocardia yamanashiensis]
MTEAHDLEFLERRWNSLSDDAGIPRLAFAPIPRRDLLDELDAVAETPDGSVLLVRSPVGTGKTAVLAQWAARARRQRGARRRVAWLTVDQQSPATLWQQLRTRLGFVNPAHGPFDTPLAAADALAGALAECGERALIVLDDAHLITDPPTLAAVEHLLLHAPPTVMIVVAGRFEPPIRWHLLELSARLRRWGAIDLAFSAAETRRLCGDQGCELADAELATLLELTRGWPALVRLSAVYLTARQDDSAAALTALARLPASIADLLAAELIDTLSPDLRMFLTYTSVPAEFTEQLADELVGGGAGHRLQELERSNFPLTSVVRGTEIRFAYHPMLRAYFRAELDRLGPDLAAELHLRTSLHLQSTREPEAALPHVLAMPNRQPLLAFLREHALHLTISGHGASLFEALTAIDPALPADPYLRWLRVVDALVHGDTGAARAHFEAMRERPDDQESLASAEMRTALAAAVTCELAVTTGLALDDRFVADALPATGHADLDGYARIETATALVVRGDLAAGEERLRQGLAVAELSAQPRLRVRALTRLSVSAALAGAVTTTRQRAEHALELARTHALLDTPEAVQATALAAFGAYVQGDPAENEAIARTLAEHTLLDGSLGATGGWQAHLIGSLVAFDTADNKIEAADRLRHSFVRVLDTSPVPATSAGLIALVVWPLLRVRETYEAQLLIEQSRTALGDSPEIAIARAALAETAHRSRGVLELVDPVLAEEVPLHPVHRVTAWLLHAAAHHALDDVTRARDGVEHGLRQAAAERIARPFLEVPGALTLLDRFTGSFGRYDAFATRLRHHPLARRRTGHSTLTGTELKVLRQLPSGRTMQQIADDLGVSINTVKTHLRAIYAKLGTNSRVAVLGAARSSGLL